MSPETTDEVAALRAELSEAQSLARAAGRLLAASRSIAESRSTRRRWQEQRSELLERLDIRPFYPPRERR
jgi:hypothetical protein